MRLLPRLLVALGVAAVLAAPAHAGVRVGEPVPALALVDAAGDPVGLERFRGRVVILDFTASWCAACRTALPELEALGARYAARGVTVVTIAIDADRADADRFLAEVVPNRTMTVLYDPSARALARVGAAGMPAHYVIDGAGIARFVASGYRPDRAAAISAVLDALLAAPTP